MESVKKCVITYLPNSAALKMDGATTLFRFLTQFVIGVGGHVVTVEV